MSLYSGSILLSQDPLISIPLSTDPGLFGKENTPESLVNCREESERSRAQPRQSHTRTLRGWSAVGTAEHSARLRQRGTNKSPEEMTGSGYCLEWTEKSQGSFWRLP